MNSEIERAIDQNKKNNHKISSVIMSGHSDGAAIHGSVGSDSPRFHRSSKFLRKKLPR